MQPSNCLLVEANPKNWASVLCVVECCDSTVQPFPEKKQNIISSRQTRKTWM